MRVKRSIRVDFPSCWEGVNGWRVVRFPSKKVSVICIGDSVEDSAFVLKSCMGGGESLTTFASLKGRERCDGGVCDRMVLEVVML